MIPQALLSQCRLMLASLCYCLFLFGLTLSFFLQVIFKYYYCDYTLHSSIIEQEMSSVEEILLAENSDKKVQKELRLKISLAEKERFMQFLFLARLTDTIPNMSQNEVRSGKLVVEELSYLNFLPSSEFLSKSQLAKQLHTDKKRKSSLTFYYKKEC